MAQRRSLFERLDALERELEKLRPAATDRGHNRPPELLPAADEDFPGQISAAASDIRTELEKPAPDVSKIARGARFLRWVSVALRAVRREAGKVGQKV